MKLLVVLPAAEGVYPPEAQQRRIEVIQSYASPGVEIVVGSPAEVSGFNPYGGSGTAMEIARNHLLVAERMIQAEQEGFDACLPFGMLDFGVEIARSRCSIPIVGQAQATYAMAAMMANRIGVITYQTRTHPMTWRQLREYGFLHLVVGFGAGGMPNSQMHERRQELFENFVAEGKRLMRDGAELIVCAGMSMCPVEFTAREFTEAIGVPVLEGMACGVAMAEAWVRTGIPYSRARYPQPR